MAGLGTSTVTQPSPHLSPSQTILQSLLDRPLMEADQVPTGALWMNEGGDAPSETAPYDVLVSLIDIYLKMHV